MPVPLFPTIRNLFHHSDEDVNRIDNVMMLVAPLHREFGRFSFILEETNVSDRYRVKTLFPISKQLPPALHVRVRDSSKFLLAVHAAVGTILYATGRGELIAKTMKHLGGSGGHALAKDGSTNVEELLSVTGLSLLAINPSHCSQAREEKHSRHVGPAGAEIQPPSVTDE